MPRTDISSFMTSAKFSLDQSKPENGVAVVI